MPHDPLTILCGLGCAAAVLIAAHHPRDGRWEAASIACLLLVNWALFILAYTDWSPKLALEHIGIDTTSVHLWMIADAIGGCAAIALAFRFWWGWALWAVAMVQIGFHAGMEANIFDPVFYTDILLNFALLVQLAIFFAMGGPNAWGTWTGLLRRLGRVRLSRRSARTQDARRSAR